MVNNTLYFAASDDVHSVELWALDISVGINGLSKVQLSTTAVPNPYTTETTIQIHGIAENIKAELVLLDVLGNEVGRKMFNNNSVIVEKANLSSGIYLYKVISENNFTATGKIILN